MLVLLFIVFKYLLAQAQGLASAIGGGAETTYAAQRENYETLSVESRKVKYTKAGSNPQSISRLCKQAETTCSIKLCVSKALNLTFQNPFVHLTIK